MYDYLRRQISQVNTDLLAAATAVKKRVRVATRHLRAAIPILAPLGQRTDFDLVVGTKPRSLVETTSLDHVTPLDFSTIDRSIPPLVGAGAGFGTAAGSWAAVQVVGHASTGTAMAALHGAAAANAGWAWFGGGSLATDGGGMAAGHFILPGIGTAVAIGISATISHRRANRIADLCNEIEGLNRNNSSALLKGQSDLDSLNRLKETLRSEDRLLHEAVNAARKRLRPFGWFSHLRRLLRFWIKGYYYTGEEFILVTSLDAAVLRFVTAFKVA
ncbi:MAG TPA: hypothetical protein VGQ12_17610 [Candidatus Angelobacter sp.]|jgi:hypothetical protein|nr:hypothetical protein [Candidatus Angelobacter sp.]